MQFTFYGHACFLVKTKGKSILFDPFISPNPMAKDIDVQNIECDYIAVSHAHSDHIADLIPIAKRTKALVIGSHELGAYLKENEIENFHTMNVGGSFNFDFGRITMTNAIHSNSIEGRYMGVAAGFVIDNEEDCFYYAGDTALTYDMKLLKHKFNIKVAALPIGGNYTMDYKDAAVAADFVECRTIVGLHYDTMESIVINHDQVKSYFKNSGKNIHLINIGETINF